MNQTKRLVTDALLFVLSSLLLKAFLPPLGFNDCKEFAHIHRFELSKIFTKASSVAVLSSHGGDKNDDENCHGSQSIFNASVEPVRIFVWTNPIPKIVFKFVLRTENRFESPDLDPPRQPPRYA